MKTSIQAKLAKGDLPRGEWERTRLVQGGMVGACVGCDTPTTPTDVAVWCEHGGRHFVLHPDCYVAWDQAREVRDH